MSGATDVVLVRHGHTASNGEGLDVAMSGWTDLPLNTEGMADAQRVASYLTTALPPSCVYSSPLTRALATARWIVEGRELELCIEPDLREIYCGEPDGLSLREVQRLYPEHWARNLRQDDPEFRWPGGECYRELRERSVRALLSIAARHPCERVVVVTHAGVISQILGWITGCSPACWERHRPRNGSITQISVKDGRATLVEFDELPPPLSSTSMRPLAEARASSR